MATTTLGKGSIRDSAVSSAKLLLDRASLAKVSNNVITMNAGGDKVGIFNDAAAYTLDVTGTINAFSTITQNGVAVCLSDNAALTNARTPTAHTLVTTTGHTLAGGTTDKILIVTGATTYDWGTVNTNSITADAVTYAKIQNVSATSRVLGRIAALAGDVEELTGANVMTIMGVNPTALGDLFYGSAAGTYTRLAGNTTVTKKFLRQTGDSSVSAAPAWDTLAATDIPSHATNASTYGYGDGTNAGHLRVGAGITYTTGTISIVSAAGTAGSIGTLSVDVAGATAKIGVSLGSTSTTACSGADSRLHTAGSDNQNIFSHIHAYSTGTTDVTNSPFTVATATDSIQLVQGTNITLSMAATTGIITIAAPAYGSTTGTICQGDDSRLSNARTPTSHTLASHTSTGTDGHFFKMGATNTFGWAAHGLTYSDVGACATGDARLSDARTPTAHAANASTYGYGDATNAGHVRKGNGITVTTGTLSIVSQAGTASTIGTINIATDTIGVSLGATSTTACAGDDSRLSNARTPTSHTIESHTATVSSGKFMKGTGTNTFGWADHGLSYSDVGACATGDSRLSDARTPTSHTIASHSTTCTDHQVLVGTGANTFGWGTLDTTGIADEAVTYAKMQHVSATSKVLGRQSAGAGDIQEISMTDAATASTVVVRDASGGAKFVNFEATGVTWLGPSTARFAFGGGTIGPPGDSGMLFGYASNIASISCLTNGTGYRELALNPNGGLVSVGSGGFKTSGLESSGAIYSRGSMPFSNYYAGYKSWTFHHPTSENLILVPSTVADGDTWDWTNQYTFGASGTLTAKAFSGPLTGNVTGNAATATTATNLSGGSVSATTGTFSGAVALNGNTKIFGVRIDPSTSYTGTILFDPQPYIDAGVRPVEEGYLQHSGGTFATINNAISPYGKVWRVVDHQRYYSTIIPVHAGETLYGEIWAMRDNGAAGTAGNLYFGVGAYDKDYVQVATWYIVTAAAVPTTGVWTKYSGTITLPTSHTPANGSDGGAIRYVRAVAIANWEFGTIETNISGILLRRQQLVSDSGLVTIPGALTVTGTITGNVTGNTSGSSGSCTGTAAIATATTITDDTTTAATMYPTWVTANTGNLSQKVTSTKLTFNPSTGTLNSTIVSGTLVKGMLAADGGVPAVSGTTQTYGSLRLGAVSSTGVLDFGYNGSGHSWIQATSSADLSLKYNILLNPNGGNVIFGAAGLRIYQGVSDGVTTNIDIRANASTGSMILNSTGTGAVYFNYDHGTGGANFCNGAGVVAASITSGGTLQVNPTGSNYSEGIRIAPSTSGGYSVIQLGANPASTTGTRVGQWGIHAFPSGGAYKFTLNYNSADVFNMDTTGVILNKIESSMTGGGQITVRPTGGLGAAGEAGRVNFAVSGYNSYIAGYQTGQYSDSIDLYFFTVYANGGVPLSRMLISGSNNYISTQNSATFRNAAYNDYAEKFPTPEVDTLEAGDILCRNPHGDGYIKVTEAYSHGVIGVFSDSYGYVVGGAKKDSEGNIIRDAQGTDTDDENTVPVGLCGRVWVKVTGEVHECDLLVSSHIPGVAMTSDGYIPGTVIGKAMESHTGDSVDRIELFIMNM